MGSIQMNHVPDFTRKLSMRVEKTSLIAYCMWLKGPILRRGYGVNQTFYFDCSWVFKNLFNICIFVYKQGLNCMSRAQGFS